MELHEIQIKGARQHNLKNIDVSIPKRKLVVLTGVSGSGKSSLAFDTLYAEGQRRYVESLSSYARQFLGQMDKPLYDTIRGLSPTIAIQQKTASSNPRSTVGTITEVADYLRVLYARVGEQHCHRCGRRVEGQTAEQIAAELAALDQGSKFVLLSPVLVNRKGEHRELLADLRRRGFVRLRVDGAIQRAEDLTHLAKNKKHQVEVVIDRFVAGEAEPSRLAESVELALKTGNGTLHVEVGGAERIYSSVFACPDCKLSFPTLTPQSFSFNSPQGMCPDCQGLGSRLAIDPSLLIPDPALSLDQGAVLAWGPDVSQKTNWAHDFRAQIVKHLQISTGTPWRSLSDAQKRRLLWGTGDRKYRVQWQGKSGHGHFDVAWEGLIPRLMRRYAQTKSDRAKHLTARFIAQARCDTCEGTRLRPESRAVQLAGHRLEQLSRQTIDGLIASLTALQLSATQRKIATELLKEIQARLRFLAAVGLGYLSLERSGPSLSGGEAQRIRLASQVGSELTGVTYVLDEPSIGLHPKDNQKLIATLKQMRDIGNTVLVVEHDEDTIRAADHVIDFGPGAGVLGGKVVHAGSVASLLRAKASLTGQYLSGRAQVSEPSRARAGTGRLSIKGARSHNLKNLSVDLPLQAFTVVTGASGAGKSTLINDVLHPALSGLLEGRPLPRLCQLAGHESLQRVINVDQKPIGRTPRSNPATYIKAFDEIRELYAQLPLARARGYAPGRFSFNVEGGRCEACQGDGVRKIEMHFLADVFVHCEQCQGRRFNAATLEVAYRGRSIADALDLTIDEAAALFASIPRLIEPLGLLQEVGLGYLQLGQPSPTLSGGEAQRIKLARELVKKSSGGALYILDEPTTGLHFHDTGRLITVLHKLVDAGNTVIVIEHNLDLVLAADHVIDLGPGGGPEGGQLVAQGSPAQVARCAQSATGRYLDKLLASRRGNLGRGKKSVPRAKLAGGRGLSEREVAL